MKTLTKHSLLSIALSAALLAAAPATVSAQGAVPAAEAHRPHRTTAPKVPRGAARLRAVSGNSLTGRTRTIQERATVRHQRSPEAPFRE